MRRLKFRRTVDTLPNEPRRHRQAVIRWVYITTVVGLAVFVGDLFFGSLFYLRSEGLVLGDEAVIAAEFPVTVRDIYVHQGDRVRSGDTAAIVSSQSVTESIARLSAELATHQTRLGELRIRGETAEAIIGLAQMRHNIAASTRKELETIMARGLLATDRRISAVESEYKSEQDLNSLNAEKRVIDGQIKSLAAVLDEAAHTVAELRGLYNQGRMAVPIDGIVGRVATQRGAVVRTGDPLFEIYSERRYVLGYLPTGGLYEVKPSDPVWIDAGLRSVEGTVAKVEPIAAALPREFQRAFTPVERQQVIRIEFAAGEAPLPLFTKVKLRSKLSLSDWIASRWPLSLLWQT